MPRRYRQLTLIFFVIAFLILAPLVLLYTQGYRYNFKRGAIQKTGILIVSSIPRRADILLNGESVRHQTPAKLEQILPGDYEITLHKDGYHDWTKRLPVRDNSTTFAEDVLLFRQSQAELLSPLSGATSTISRDRGYAAYIQNDHTLSIMNLRRGELFSSYQTQASTTISDVEWSASNRRLLLTLTTATTTAHRIIDLDQISNGGSIISPIYQELHWDSSNDTVLYGQRDDGLWRYDSITREERLVTTSATTTAYTIHGGTLYTHDGSGLYAHTNGTSQRVTEIRCVACRFIQQTGPRLLLFNSRDRQLLSLSPKGDSRPISTAATGFDWLDQSVMLIYNPWELWIYDLRLDNPELITRVGQPIERAIWHPGGRHMLFVSHGDVSIIELDNRETRTITTLAHFDSLNDILSLTNGSALYITGTTNNQTGLFRLELE